MQCINVYPKIYESRAVGRRRILTGRWDRVGWLFISWESASPWLPKPVSGSSTAWDGPGWVSATDEVAWSSAGAVAGGGMLQGIKRSTCTRWRERLSTYLMFTTRGLQKDSIRQGPVHNCCSFLNFCRTGGLGQNNQTNCPWVNLVWRDLSS